MLLLEYLIIFLYKKTPCWLKFITLIDTIFIDFIKLYWHWSNGSKSYSMKNLKVKIKKKKKIVQLIEVFFFLLLLLLLDLFRGYIVPQ